MVLFNYSTRELTAKIVYYGPGLCGKTTNLQYIHANLPDNIRGKMLSLATKTDRTLFFDFLPVDLGEIRGMRTRVQLYTVPGQVFYNETRKLVLKGADGIVFVADSQEQMLGANVESFRNLEENLKGHGLKLAEMPHIIQFNKRDLPKLASIEDLNSQLNRYNAPFYESVATSGIGVQDTLKAIFKLVLLQLTRKYDPKAVPAQDARPARVAVPAPPAPAPRAEAPPARSIPVAAPPAAARPASIPLSAMDAPAAGLRAAKQAPPGTSAPVDEPEDMPAFATEEIDDLVHEVEESYPVAARAEAPSIAVSAAAPAPAAPKLARSTPPSRPADGQFEVDRGFDPEWAPETSSVRPEELLGDLDAGAAVDLSSPAAIDLPPADQEEEIEIPIPVRQADPVDESQATLGEPAVFLTEVAEDRHLFEDPSLDVARFAAGDHREIVVPVEFTEGGAVRRFKLSIHLRFDPLD